MKNIFLFISLVFFFSSCETPLSYDGPELKEQLVLFSFNTAGKPLQVKLSHSQFALNPTDHETFIEDAVVSYSVNGGSYQPMLYTQKGFYNSTHIVSIGDLISVKAEHPLYDNIRAEARVPKQATYQARIKEKGQGYVELIIDVQDNTETNYYNISAVIEFKVMYKYGQGLTSNVYDFSSIDPLLTQRGNSYFQNEENKKKKTKAYFSNETFKGTTRSFVVRFESEEYVDLKDSFSAYDVDSIKLDVSQLSYSYFTYKSSYDVYNRNLTDVFSEQTQIFSNVVNGLGVLAFRTPNLVLVDIAP